MYEGIAQAVEALQGSWKAEIQRALNEKCETHTEKVSLLQGVVRRATEGLTDLKKSIKSVDGLWPLVRDQYTSAEAALLAFQSLLDGRLLRYQAAVPGYTEAEKIYASQLRALHGAVVAHGRSARGSSMLRRTSSFFGKKGGPLPLAHQLSQRWHDDTFAVFDNNEMYPTFESKKAGLLACIEATRGALEGIPQEKTTVLGLLDLLKEEVNNKTIKYYHQAVPQYFLVQKEIEKEIAGLDKAGVACGLCGGLVLQAGPPGAATPAMPLDIGSLQGFMEQSI